MAPSKTPKIPISVIQELKTQMLNMPAAEPTEMSLVQAIRALAPDIRDMQARGYTMAQVADILTSTGIRIATTTLRSYLSRFVVEPMKPLRKGPRRVASKRDVVAAVAERRPEGGAEASSHAPAPTGATRPPTLRTTSGSAARSTPPAAAASSTVPAREPAASPAKHQRTTYGFIPREDSDEI